MTFSQYLHQLALLVRLPNAFTVTSNVAAAWVIGSHAALDWQIFVSLLLAGLSFYHGGMILNDCLDIKEDRQFNPRRPLAARTISPLLAWLLCLYLFVFAVAILFSFDTRTLVYGLLLLACIVSYNVASRKMYFACVLMGLCRCLLWLVVLSAMGALERYAHFAVLVGIYVMALTFLSRDENLAEKKWLPSVTAICLLFGCVFFVFMQSQHPGAADAKLLVLAGFVALMLIRLVYLQRNYTPQTVRATVMFFILGLIPLDATLLFISGHFYAAILVLLLIIPGRFLAKFLYVS